MRLLTGILIALCVIVADAQERPSALLRIERQRKALQTGEVAWSWRDARRGMETWYTSRFTDGEDVLILRGDKDGVVFRTEGGRPSPVAPKALRRTLTERGRAWLHRDGSPGASLRERKEGAAGVIDLRSLGLSLQMPCQDVDETLWHDAVPQAGARTYEEHVEAGLHAVTAHTEYGDITWWIDPERGWSPVRVTLEQDGKVVLESRSTLKKYDGIWYPEVVAYFRSSYREGREPANVIKIVHAEFNKPDQPKRLTASDIGVEVGTDIIFKPLDGPPDLVYWDGQRVISSDEYNKRMASGELVMGPTVSMIVARLEAKQQDQQLKRPTTLETTLTQWEAYTLDFIITYGLDTEQSQRAWLICEQCQERARAYVAGKKRLFEENDQRLGAIAAPGAHASADQRKRLMSDRRKLFAPVRQIFDKQLAPRLDKLPTRAQRKAAAERDSAGTNKDKKAKQAERSRP